MQYSGFGFLVRSHELDRFCSLQVHRGQLSPAKHAFANALAYGVMAEANIVCNSCSRNHSPRNGLAMQKLAIACASFESVADGVSEIQDAAEITFALVSGDNLRLQSDRFSNRPSEKFRVLAQLFDRAALQPHK